ncbi:MAG: adenylosuccinate lyase [Prevotellaceae bacterium]|jgi:adenylosuccinate lyase|nr:adenylosuccinate lyase [Prevotellaceae bacterium]
MNLHSLTAISPIDGRYSKQTEMLSPFFSESALIKYRIMVEVEYFIALCELPLPQLSEIDKSCYAALRNLYRNFNVENALHIKETEKTTNHDVKAVEYFLKEKFTDLGLSNFREFVHFGLTSQDINNTAVPYSLHEALSGVYYPLLNEIVDYLSGLTVEWRDVPMLARTHGQPASPTHLGKEIDVFVERIGKQTELLKTLRCSAKFGGATGNFNAHNVAYPQIDWRAFANNFVENILNLERSQSTTQIDHYDKLAAIFDNLKRINVIFIDLCRDIWTYISLEYFKQKIKAGEIGSSAMPHKVNPIDFENAEGNFGLANALFEHLSAKLPISRLQRDLTDSTVLRNIGVPIAHTIIGFKSVIKGLSKIYLNEDAIYRDLDKNWMVVAEAIQTILRREAYPNAYEKLKELTRTNEIITEQNIKNFIDTLDVSDEIKQELKNVNPRNYTGLKNNHKS